MSASIAQRSAFRSQSCFSAFGMLLRSNIDVMSCWVPEVLVLAELLRFCPHIAVRLGGGATAAELGMRPAMAITCTLALTSAVTCVHSATRCLMAWAGRT